MRYSMLVYLTNMGKTLLEAARYLRTAEDHALQKELLENGRQMIGQIRGELERHSGDLRTSLPLERLQDIKALWGTAGRSGELEAALEEFTGKLPEEVFYRVRAVFFAELGEKWDAMESVYEFMRDDPRFDPVVVLTPIYRIVNRNGKQEQEVIYKDYLTPMGIPFLHYNKYSLEDDCPDLAFTSQPYEGCTPKEYWPEYIAKYTRLVYLFYYVPCLIFEESPVSLCQMPVYRYAWKVAGASRRHYDYYCRYAVNGGANMVVTGIPKFDSTIRLKNEGTDLPDSWKPVIEGRKVILWNTWYDCRGSSVEYFDAIVDWLRSHDDCALIWRPHPMTDTVTKLYYPPEAYAQLQRRIATADQLPNMIYDREVSCNKAFSSSAAQISDYSSLMFQYLLLDKPVLWTKRHGTYGPYRGMKDDFIIDWRWMEEAEQISDVLAFLERIRLGIDQKAEVRKNVLLRDVPLADGRCAQRTCEALWTAMHREDLGRGSV